MSPVDDELDALTKALHTNRRRGESYTDHITRLLASETITRLRTELTTARERILELEARARRVANESLLGRAAMRKHFPELFEPHEKLEL